MRYIFFFTFYLLSLSVCGQDLSDAEEELNRSLLHLRSATSDEEIRSRNNEFRDEIFEFFKLEGALDYQFKYCKSIASLMSPDKLVRILTWNLEFSDFTYSYDGLVILTDKKRKKKHIHRLLDQSSPYDGIPEGVIDQNNWYGALYYKILPFSRKGKTEYVLLGWDGASSSSNFKFIDVMNVNRSGVKFGSPVFQENKTVFNRVIFEYAELAKMSLRYDEKYKRLIFDHLSPESPSLAGVKSYYVPDMSYDAFIEKNGMWYLKSDVIAINDGDLKSEKKTWQNPSDENTNNIHVARTPEIDIEVEEQKDEFPEIKKRRMKRKNNPEYLQMTTGKYKSKRRRNK